VRNHSSTPPGIPPKWTVTEEGLGTRRITLRVGSLTPAEASDLAGALRPDSGRCRCDASGRWSVEHERGDVVVRLGADTFGPAEAQQIAKALRDAADEARTWRETVLRAAGLSAAHTAWPRGDRGGH